MRYQVASRPCLRLPEAPMNTPLVLPPPAACRRPLFEKPSFRLAHSNQTQSRTSPALPPCPPVLLPASLPLCPRACASACRPAFVFWLYRHNVLCTRPTLNQSWSRSMHYCPACLPALLPFCLPCLPALAPASQPPPPPFPLPCRLQLESQVAAVSEWLLKSLRLKPGDRVVLSFPPGLKFLVAFLSCLAAGIIAGGRHRQ
jgi:hypothetical protein